MSQAGSIHQGGHGTKAVPAGASPRFARGDARLSPSTSHYWGAPGRVGISGTGRDRAGALRTPGGVFSGRAQSFPVYGHRADSRGTLSFSSPAISPGLPARFSRAFLSFGFHGDLGRQEIRQSFRQLCEGKQEAGRREAGQHRPAPPHQALRPAIPRCPKGTRVRGGVEAPGRSLADAGEKTQVPSSGQRRGCSSHRLPAVTGTTSVAPSTAHSAKQVLSGIPASTPTRGGTPGPPRWGPVHCVSLLGKRTCPTTPPAVTTAEAGPPRATSPASAQQEQRAACSPTTEGLRHRSPSGLAWPQGSGAEWTQREAPTQAQLLALLPRVPPSHFRNRLAGHDTWDVLVLKSPPGHLCVLCPSGNDVCRVRPSAPDRRFRAEQNLWECPCTPQPPADYPWPLPGAAQDLSRPRPRSPV